MSVQSYAGKTILYIRSLLQMLRSHRCQGEMGIKLRAHQGQMGNIKLRSHQCVSSLGHMNVRVIGNYQAEVTSMQGHIGTI
jgi:hypothetical protein